MNNQPSLHLTLHLVQENQPPVASPLTGYLGHRRLPLSLAVIRGSYGVVLTFRCVIFIKAIILLTVGL